MATGNKSNSRQVNKPKKVAKRKAGINIGLIVFAFILIYVVVYAINYFSKSTVNIFEVRATTMAQDNIVTGLIIREETIINAPEAGYMNYYSPEGVRIGKDKLLCSLDETKEIYDSLINADVSKDFSENDRKYIRSVINDYRSAGGFGNYELTASFASDISTIISTYSGNYSVDKVSEITDKNLPSTFHKLVTTCSGLVSYNIDELSGISLETFTGQEFANSTAYKNYNKRKNMANGGEGVAKVITGDTWEIICPLNESQRKALSNLKTLPITICNTGTQLTLPFEIIEKNGSYFAVFTLSEYVQNYLNYRFLSVELNWQISEGYKIPLSSITEKTFFIVPITYFSKGGNSNSLGLIKEEINSKTGAASFNFTETTIYYSDGMYYYIDATDFKEGDTVMSESGERYTISLKEKLEGVYNVNKGYAVFRRIERITQNTEYCIVNIGTAYGITLYDHIALDATKAVDLGIIY